MATMETYLGAKALATSLADQCSPNFAEVGEETSISQPQPLSRLLWARPMRIGSTARRSKASPLTHPVGVPCLFSCSEWGTLTGDAAASRAKAPALSSRENGTLGQENNGELGIGGQRRSG